MSLFKHRHKWEVRKTIWPYKEGYGTYCPGCRTVLDTGLTEQAAKEECAKLNGKAKP